MDIDLALRNSFLIFFTPNRKALNLNLKFILPVPMRLSKKRKYWIKLKAPLNILRILTIAGV